LHDEPPRDTVRLSIKRGKSLYVLFIDIDQSKSVNDGHGHAAEDAVLREFATRIRAATPATSILPAGSAVKSLC